jgi:predicted nucleic acid-binding protein
VRKFDVYVETSVWGAAADVEPAYYRKAADKLLARAGDFDFYVTDVVLAEVAAAAPAVRKGVEEVIKRASPSELEITADVAFLAGEYIKRGVFPARYEADALHVAAACHYAMDYLVSYNFRHIVRVSRRELIKSANAILGVATPQIISPEELAEEEWG